MHPSLLVTLALIAVTCVVTYAAFNKATLWHKLVMWPPGVFRKHEYWRLFTSGFVHADLQHLLFNMITLFFFGGPMASFFLPRIGVLGFVLFYLLGLFMSAWPGCVRHRHDTRYVSLGASGAVSSVLFGFILLKPWALIFVFFIPVPAILFAAAYIGYSVYMDRRGRDHINHSAHLWGAAWGLVATVGVEPHVLTVFFQNLLHPGG